MPKQHLNLL